MIKTCAIHGETEFSSSKRPRCKKCAVDAVNKRRRKIKEMAIEYKDGACSICGYNKSNWALDFHHIDPKEKDFSIGAKGHCRSWNEVKKELDKCILVCRNCHAELHEKLERGI